MRCRARAVKGRDALRSKATAVFPPLIGARDARVRTAALACVRNLCFHGA